jgi:glutathione-regulated potassium-efflux system protein KefB
MGSITLEQAVWLLAAAAVAAPLAKMLKIGSVLGYLLAGVLMGPFGVGKVFSEYSAENLLHIAEFGVVLLLFLIGLELRPRRLMTMRQAIFGLGGAQVGITGVIISIFALAIGQPFLPALFIGLVLSLSSTAFALQVLEERGELTAKHGRLAFAVLLFQDLAAIPLIALTPFFAVSVAGAAAKMDILAAGRALLTIVAVVVVGRFLIDRVLRLIARTKVREAMTAAALLTVVGVSLVMTKAGLSPSLGAFLAGALLAESSYRHQLEADIQPFEGLLLGMFFTAVGMTLNVELVLTDPGTIAGLVLLLVGIKLAVLYGLGRWHGLEPWAARRLGLSISQGGEFAFVLLAAGVAAGVMTRHVSEPLEVAVTLSMALTPLLLMLDDQLGREPHTVQQFVAPPPEEGHVIIAGFGRFGQIIARILRAKRIPFTALDINPEQIALVERFGSRAFFGDASRLEILEAAQVGKARALVLAIDDVEASMRTARIVRENFAGLPIYARARNRNHVHRLMDLGVKVIRRETYHSALDLSREVLRGLGMSEAEVRTTVETFARHDERRLTEHYKFYTDEEKMMELARSDADVLASLFAEDQAADQEPAGPMAAGQEARQAAKKPRVRV